MLPNLVTFSKNYLKTFCDICIRFFFYFRADFGWCFEVLKNPEIQDADQDGCHSEMVTQLLSCDVIMWTSKETFFRHTIYPPRNVVIALIFLELRRGEESTPPFVEHLKKPGLNRIK